MLALPVLTGYLLRLRAGVAGGLPLLPVVACWLAGYLAFHAATVWLKAPPGRKASARTPLLIYGAAATGLGLVSLAWGGTGLLGWVVPFGPLVAAALALAAGRRERSLASGALTVAAASLMTLVVRFVTPQALGDALGSPAGTRALWYTGLVFAYLFGTVLYVKTMIRERGSRRWWAASLAWHGLATAVAAAAAVAGLLPWPWTALFAATVVRAWLVPVLAARRPVRPLAVGLVEIAFTAAFVMVAAAA